MNDNDNEGGEGGSRKQATTREEVFFPGGAGPCVKNCKLPSLCKPGKGEYDDEESLKTRRGKGKSDNETEFLRQVGIL